MSKLPVVEISDEKAAHTILNSLLTQAAITKKSFKTKFKISYLDLMRGIGEDGDELESYADVSLQVELRCKWVDSDEVEEDIIIDEIEDGGDKYE